MTEEEGQRELDMDHVETLALGIRMNPELSFHAMQCMIMQDDVTPTEVQEHIGDLMFEKPEEEDRDGVEPSWMHAILPLVEEGISSQQ